MKLNITFRNGLQIICCQFYLSQEVVTMQTTDGKVIRELPVDKFNARLAKWFSRGVKIEVARPAWLDWNSGVEIA